MYYIIYRVSLLTLRYSKTKQGTCIRGSRNTQRQPLIEVLFYLEVRMVKKCNKCGKIKDIIEFNKQKSSKDGYARHCKECIAKRWKEYYRKNKQKINAHENERYANDPNYRKTLSIQRKERRDNNPEYRKELIDYHKAYMKERCANDPEFHKKVISRSSKYQKEKWANDPEFRKKAISRNVVYLKERYANDLQFSMGLKLRYISNTIFKTTKAQKNKKNEYYLGCSYKVARNYLLSLGYEPSLDIDHIVCLSAFNLEIEDHKRIAAHYTNLNPLDPYYNRYIKKTNLVSTWREKITTIANQINIDPLPIIDYIEAQNIEIITE